MINPQSSHRIEEAIKFLVHAVEESGHNPKPVVLHSIEVALYLRQLDYSDEIVIGAVLHDVLEDTGVTGEELQKKFGEKVASMVGALSFDPNIKDRDERGKLAVDKCVGYGKEAMIVKAADMFKNSDYIDFAPDQKTKEYVLGKIRYFLDESQPLIGTEEPWIDLSERFLKLNTLL